MDLILVKHGENVGSRSLGPFFGARPAGGFATRHPERGARLPVGLFDPAVV